MKSTNISDLKKFLYASNAFGFASGQEKKWAAEADKSTTIVYSQGPWKSHDNFFGGEPYGGRLVVFHKNKPVWIIVYYGWVERGIDPNTVYPVLRNALKRMPADHPFRGPKKFEQDDFVYKNKWNGNVAKYFGEEQIKKGKRLVYKANYMGGMVDVRRGV